MLEHIDLYFSKSDLNINEIYFPFQVTLSGLVNQPLFIPSWFLPLAIFVKESYSFYSLLSCMVLAMFPTHPFRCPLAAEHLPKVVFISLVISLYVVSHR